MQEYTDQKNSEYGHFPRSAKLWGFRVSYETDLKKS